MRGIWFASSNRAGFLADADQGADVVEQVDEQEDEDNFEQAELHRAADIEFAEAVAEMSEMR